MPHTQYRYTRSYFGPLALRFVCLQYVVVCVRENHIVSGTPGAVARAQPLSSRPSYRDSSSASRRNVEHLDRSVCARSDTVYTTRTTTTTRKIRRTGYVRGPYAHTCGFWSVSYSVEIRAYPSAAAAPRANRNRLRIRVHDDESILTGAGRANI